MREAIVNAVTHRNYLLKGQDIKVAIFDNRIEISSPGDLPAGYSVDDIGKMDFSKLRNITIGRIFSELKIIEQWGRGFSNIIESCKKYENIILEFKEELLQFKVIFWNRMIEKKVAEKVVRKSGQKRWSGKVVRKSGQKKWSELTQRQAEILQLIKENQKITRKMLSEKLNINPSAVQKHINKLKQTGILKIIGPDKGGYWEIVE